MEKKQRIFVTGATGFIGSAIVKELTGNGYRVLGLARSDVAAAALAAAGADVHRGSLDDVESLRSGAANSDGVIHTAFNHDFSRWKENSENDRRAIEALGQALAGSKRRLIVTSGTALLTPGRLATEDVKPTLTSNEIPRIASEEAADVVAAQGVNVSVVRLPPSVHGEGDHGFVPALIGLAREKGVCAYIGDGLNRWPAVHRLDAAQVFVRAFEEGAAGARYHGVGDEGVAFREIAETIGRHLDVRTASLSPERSADHFGWLAHFAAIDCPASSAWTQAQLAWHPTHIGLLEDLERGHYFEMREQLRGGAA